MTGRGGEGKVALSVVVPAYNEEARLPRTLEEMVGYLDAQEILYEVLVVDDGSRDGTAKYVEDFSTKHPSVRLLSYSENRGKGYAVRFGALAASGSRVLFADADGATPFPEVARLNAAISQGADVAIGSRALFGKDTQIKTVWYRKIPGRIFAGIVNLLVLPGIKDTQCGFKMFTRPTAKMIFSRQQAERFSFDVEVLFLARRAGLKISEVPISWTNIPGSKVNLLTDSISMFRDVVRFRLRALSGGYAKVEPQEKEACEQFHHQVH